MLSVEANNLLKLAADSIEATFVCMLTDGGFYFSGYIGNNCDKSVSLQNLTVKFPSGNEQSIDGTVVIEKEKTVAVWMGEKTLARLVGEKR
jgi:hypothetical protein